MPHTNAISWFEIPVKDIDRAQQFYETVIGQSMQRQMFLKEGGVGETCRVEYVRLLQQPIGRFGLPNPLPMFVR